MTDMQIPYGCVTSSCAESPRGSACSASDRGVNMPQSDLEYYRQRASTERRMALAAERTDVAAVHEELARGYQALVDHASLRPKLHIVVSTLLPA